MTAMMGPMKVYTRTGDDGTTGLLFGTRVRKDDPRPSAYGDVDEAQAALGLARAECEPGSAIAAIIIDRQRDLWTLMADVATAPANRHKLEPGRSLVTPEMVGALETLIDSVSERFDPPTEFVIPGGNRLAAALDLARTVVRRAERQVVTIDDGDPSTPADPEDPADSARSNVLTYLNRLSDLLWTLARWQETVSLPARPAANPPASPAPTT